MCDYPRPCYTLIKPALALDTPRVMDFSPVLLFVHTDTSPHGSGSCSFLPTRSFVSSPVELFGVLPSPTPSLHRGGFKSATPHSQNSFVPKFSTAPVLPRRGRYPSPRTYFPERHSPRERTGGQRKREGLLRREGSVDLDDHGTRT